LTVFMVRHRRDGYFFYPAGWETWPAEDQQWLRDNFTPVGLLDVSTSMRNFTRIVERIRERSSAPILVYNASFVVPGDSVHNHHGLDDTFATRVRRFNLGLIELSQQTGVSIIDVDTILARAGTDRLKVDAVHVNAEGLRLIAEEVVRVLEDYGCMSET
jgi:lysophospholipase L1-like esterase